MSYRPPSGPGPGQYKVYLGEHDNPTSEMESVRALSLLDAVRAIRCERFFRDVMSGDIIVDPEDQRWEVERDGFRSLDHDGLRLLSVGLVAHFDPPPPDPSPSLPG